MTPDAKIAVLIFILALFLRVVLPDASPPGFNDDELSNALVINQLVRAGDIRVYYPHASGHEGLYHILAAPFGSLFGTTYLGIRGLSALLGALSAALLYLLAARMWDRPTGLIAALGLTFSYWSLVYSRVGQRHISLPVFALLAFYCWQRGLAPSPPAPNTFRLSFPSIPSPFPHKGGKGARARSESPLAPCGRGDLGARAWFAAAGAALGLGFYTYFAARGVPLILIAFAGYLFLFHRASFEQHWRGMALALLVAAATAVPLAVTLQQNPTAEARVTELAAPVYALGSGDPSVLVEYGLKTLGMFTFTGDDEALYNIPRRPVFGVVGAVFFLIGLAWAIWHWKEPRCAFLLLWTAAGLAPGALAVPAASLSHTILAQPAAFIFPALGVGAAARWCMWTLAILPHPPLPPLSMAWRGGRTRAARRGVRSTFEAPASRIAAHWGRVASLLAALAIVYLGVEGARSLYDYFVVRPQDGFVRVLFHTDFIELAKYLNEHPEIQDIMIGAQINERWNQVAFEMALARSDVRARWYDPDAAVLWGPEGSYWAAPHYLFRLKESTVYQDIVAENEYFLIVRQPEPGAPPAAGAVPFALGLTEAYAGFDTKSGTLAVRWRVDAPLDLPARPLYSKPPAPGEPTTPRLEMFVHVLPAGGEAPVFATGRLGVDPYTLRVGDVFYPGGTGIPWLTFEPGVYDIAAGLYDPWTGARYLTADGQDRVIVHTFELPQ